MAVTIKDVAKIANVSPSTVSRVIAGSKRISDETHHRVKKAMRELGYYPNANARSLVKNTTDTIGLVLARSIVSALGNPFFPEVIRGITSITQDLGYRLLLSSSKNFLEEEEEALSMLKERRVDGLLLLASRVQDSLVKKLHQGNYSFVVVGRVPGIEINWVNNDNVRAAEKAISYLTELGHQKIGLLLGPLELIVSQDRLLGYKQGLQKAGIPFDPTMVQEVDFTEAGGFTGMNRLLKTHPEMTAVFAIDDLVAAGVMQAAKEQGLEIPGDISLIGFNDSPLASYMKPELTTIGIPIYEMGVQATKILINQLQNPEEKTQQVVLDSKLIVRQSCQRL